MKAAVLGAGSWGTTFAQVLCDAGTPVTLWARRADTVSAINDLHENPRYLPGITLPQTLTATSDAAAALDGADLVLLAVPAQTLRDQLTAWRPLIPGDALLVSLMKGIEHGSDKRMSEVIMETAHVPPSQVAVISGPNLAREIAERQVAASVVACSDEMSARLLQRACRTGSRSSPAPTWPGRSPSARSRRRWWPAPTSRARGCCSGPATRATSGRTGTPTCSAASLAAR